MKPRFPGIGRRRFALIRRMLNPVLGISALLFAPIGVAHTELVMNRQSLENTVSVETLLFGPVQVQLKNGTSGELLFESVLDGPGIFEMADLPPDSLNNLVLHAVPGKPHRGGCAGDAVPDDRHLHLHAIASPTRSTTSRHQAG